ncbi:MAG TPA: PIG-L deacetylase family protein [Balneolaceae bacterium]|nr:PIG-L deacetylase family protein [Balneolaceae bacterium]
MPRKEGLKILLLGAHCDDIEIGCGGTLLKMIEDYDINQIKWVVFTSNVDRKKEAVSSANEFLETIPNADITVFDYQDGYMPSAWPRIKDEFESIKKDFTPDIIFTHYRDDLHQDHRVVNELTWNTFRNHLIFEFEIPKYDGDLGTPNLFFTLQEEQVKQKNKIIFDNFKSQLNKQWFDEELLNAIMRMRGVECASETKYAEAFHTRKVII